MENNKYGEGVIFERIRRITGYLVGDYRRMNDAKQSEVKERLTHDKNNDNSHSIINSDRDIDKEQIDEHS